MQAGLKLTESDRQAVVQAVEDFAVVHEWPCDEIVKRLKLILGVAERLNVLNTLCLLEMAFRPVADVFVEAADPKEK